MSRVKEHLRALGPTWTRSTETPKLRAKRIESYMTAVSHIGYMPS